MAPILVRAAVTAALLGGLLAWLPGERLLAALARTPPWLWAAVVAAFLCGHGLTALKWRLLIGASGAPVPVGAALRAHAAGLFANLCLPSIVGGDLVRAGIAIREHGRAAGVAVGSLADRVLDTAALTALAALGALLAPHAFDGLAARILALAALGCFAGTAGALLAVRVLDPETLPDSLGFARRGLGRLREGVAALAARPGAAAGALVISLAVQTGFVGLNALLGGALGIDAAFAVWLLAWPLAKLAALLPVSLGGIGVREAALAALLAPFAVEPALAVAQSLLWETVLVAAGLLAGASSLVLGVRPGAGRSSLRGELP